MERHSIDERPCADAQGDCSTHSAAAQQDAVVQCLLGRLQKAEDDVGKTYRQWRDCQRRLDDALAKLSLLGSRKARFRAGLQAIKMRLAPPNSRRKRLLAQLFQIARGRRVNPTAVAVKAMPPLDAASPSAATNDFVSPLKWKISTDTSAGAGSLELGLMIFSANHRAGSTLLQRICNARKGTLIWGEQGGLLQHFLNAYLTAAALCAAGGKEREAYFAAGENPNLWIANMCPELNRAQQAVIDAIRAFYAAFYESQLATHDLVGFKEVAYGRGELELLRACYPRANFLLLTRNPLDTWRSTPGDWYASLDYWIECWNSRVRDFRSFAAGDARSHLIRYEDLVRKDPAVVAVLADVAKVSVKQYAGVLAHKIGSSRRDELPDEEQRKIREQCRESMELLGYL